MALCKVWEDNWGFLPTKYQEASADETPSYSYRLLCYCKTSIQNKGEVSLLQSTVKYSLGCPQYRVVESPDREVTLYFIDSIKN